MKPRLSSLVIIALATTSCVIGNDCRSQEKRKSRYEVDGGYHMLDECLDPLDECWTDCEKRFASRTCIGCCQDQGYLCNTQQPHSFDSCKGLP